MPASNGRRIKNERQYEALRREGMSKEKAARIANSGRDASVKSGKQSAYETWTKKDLYDKAKEVGIDGRSRMDKSELIDALRNHGGSQKKSRACARCSGKKSRVKREGARCADLDCAEVRMLRVEQDIGLLRDHHRGYNHRGRFA